jgi:hypothetical protein
MMFEAETALLMRKALEPDVFPFFSKKIKPLGR